MKKIKLNQSLYLNKEVVSKLQDDSLTNIKGGLAQEVSCLFASCNSHPKICKGEEKE
ncbi:class I lanthipeptide [Psychroserpens luteolus]|uniref:class I lanthipeptide n=1 Tax=Psychroserpens luteolus TaxID=2855840 RepID=UPI001E40B2C6|nr:class I lanthipeptide [Psychroserpens luteolus]MCD2258064.1 class I lanthipeptide [Psychroserpens luteolus]